MTDFRERVTLAAEKKKLDEDGRNNLTEISEMKLELKPLLDQPMTGTFVVVVGKPRRSSNDSKGM